MSKRNKSVVRIAVLFILCSLIIWHTVHWHSIGMYLKMFLWLETAKGYITVLYNLGLITALSTGMAYLLGEIMSFISYTKDTRNDSHTT